MNNINWKVRIKNKVFWVTAIPMICLLIRQVLTMFGIEIDLTGVADQLVDIVGTVFAFLALIGVAVDPTTSGVSDSAQAMTYEVPKESAEDGDLDGNE